MASIKTTTAGGSLLLHTPSTRRPPILTTFCDFIRVRGCGRRAERFPRLSRQGRCIDLRSLLKKIIVLQELRLFEMYISKKALQIEEGGGYSCERPFEKCVLLYEKLKTLSEIANMRSGHN